MKKWQPIQRLLNYRMLGMLVFSALSIAAITAADTQTPNLFTEPEMSFAFLRHRLTQHSLRSRLADIHWDTLAGLRQEDAPLVRLNLFADLGFTARLRKLTKRSDTSFSWSGELPAIPGSMLSLTVEGAVLCGHLWLPQIGTFEIAYTENGLHEIRRLDPASFPDEADSLIPFDTFGSGPMQLDDPQAPADDGSIFDVLVVYTDDARAAQGGTEAMLALVHQAVNVTNTAYENSLINSRLRLVHAGEVSYNESGRSDWDLDRLWDDNDGYMDEVHDWRETYGGDFVSLIVNEFDACGRGYLMTSSSASYFEAYAFSVIDKDCAVGPLTFPHELGHNQGCHHAVGDSGLTRGEGYFDYSHGWRFGPGGSNYRTVMAYSPGVRKPYFSNPYVDYLGYPTGRVDLEENARTINETAAIVANFRNSVFNLTSDYNGFAVFAQYWNDPNCGVCGGADFTDDGAVDVTDLMFLSDKWLTGTVP